MKKLLFVATLTACTMFALQSSGDPSTDGTGPSPVPEPATLGLMAAGMAGIGYSAWRQKRKK